MLLEDIFSEFSTLLHTRLSNSIHTTEDAIRYTFFIALLNRSKLQPHQVELESPHPEIIGAKIDTFIPSLEGKPLAIEFKYDRSIPSSGAVPRPQNAGELFADIYRLSHLTSPPVLDRLLFYCTDQIMAEYLRKPANGHFNFFDLACGHTIQIDEKYISTKPYTFRKCIGGALLVTLECLWTENLPRSHYLRIYRVLTQSSR